MYGSTGDVTPWHGYPICPDSLPDCYIDDNSEEVKISFYHHVSVLGICEVHEPGVLHGIPADPAQDPLDTEWRGSTGWLELGEYPRALVEAGNGKPRLPAQHWERDWGEIHGTGDSNPFFDSVQARGDVDGYQIRIRGENSDDTTEDGWCESLIKHLHPKAPRLVAGGNPLEHDGPHGLAGQLWPRLPRDQWAVHQLTNATTRFWVLQQTSD